MRAGSSRLTCTATGTFLWSDATARTSDNVGAQLDTCLLDKTWNSSNLFFSLWICYSKNGFVIPKTDLCYIFFISSSHVTTHRIPEAVERVMVWNGMVWYGMLWYSIVLCINTQSIFAKSGWWSVYVNIFEGVVFWGSGFLGRWPFGALAFWGILLNWWPFGAVAF